MTTQHQITDTPADDLTAAGRRYSELRAELAAIEGEIQQIGIARWKLSQEADLDRAAETLVDGVNNVVTPSLDDRRLEDLRARRELMTRAVRIAQRRRDDLQAARNREIVRALRPRHKAAVARVAQALIELSNANAEEQKIRARAPGNALPACSFPGVGILGPGDSQVKFFLAYLRRLGYSLAAEQTAAAAE